MDKVATAIVLELAGSLVELMGRIDPAWSRAYFRFAAEEFRYGSNASYVTGNEVLLISSLKWSEFFDQANEQAARLFRVLKRQKGVLLLEVDSNSNYEVKFEWENLEKWRITKLNNATGLPVGL